jgi:hypothetical protein
LVFWFFCCCCFVFCFFFWDKVSWTICLGQASNCDSPDLCLLSSWDYRCEPLAPGKACWLLNKQTLPWTELKLTLEDFPAGVLAWSSAAGPGLCSSQGGQAPAVLVTFGNLWGMQILRPHSDLLNRKATNRDQQSLC